MAVLGFIGLFFAGFSLFRNRLPLIATLKQSPFWIIYGAFLAITALSLTQSRLIGDGIFEWSKYLLGASLTLGWVAYYQSSPRTFRQTSARVIGVLGFIIGIIGLWQWGTVLLENGLKHDKLYMVNAYFAHRNVYCEALFLTFPFSFYGALYDKGILKKINQVASGIAFFLCIALLSRAIWIAVIGSTVIVGLVYLAMEYPLWKKNAEASKTMIPAARKTGIFAALALAILLFYGFSNEFSALSGFWDSITQVNYYQNNDRLQKWEHSVTLFKENPWLGIGMGDWKIDILRFPPVNSEAEYGKLYFQRPHNDYLWVLSESGIFALLAFLGIFGYLIFSVFKILKQNEDRETRNRIYLLLAGIIGYIIFSTFSFSKERIEEIVLLHALFAAILLEVKPRNTLEQTPLKTDRITGGILVFLLSAVFYVGYERTNAELILRKYQLVSDQGNTKEAIRLAEKAYRPLYEMDPISSPIRFFSGTGYLKLNDFKKAIIHLEEARTLSPNHVQVLNNLAGSYFSEKQFDKSEAIYKQAVTLAPKYTDALLSYAVVVYNKTGAENQQKAFEIMARIDTTETKEQYHTHLKTMTQIVADTLLKNTPDTLVRNEIKNTMNNRPKYLGIARRAGEKHLFSVQLYAEVLFKLYKSGAIDETEWKRLKEKYHCDIKN